MSSTHAPADVVVIGGGLVGTALAYELVTRGADTVLVDRHDPGRATDAGAGILSPETNQDPDPAFFDFGRAAAHHYDTLVSRLIEDGTPDTGFAVTGLLLVAERPGDDAVIDEAARLVGTRCPDLAVDVDPTDVSRYFPPLAPVRRALFSPVARRVDGRVLNTCLRDAARSRGIRVVAGDATGIEHNPTGTEVTAVATTEGRLPTGSVVVAGGAWSTEMAATFGTTIPVGPLKGQILHLSLPDTDSRSWPIVQPVLGFYLVPWSDGRVACGGTMEAPAGFDHRPTADGIHQLLRECLRIAPGLSQATVIEVRVGSRPATPDSRPILGRLPGWSNAFVATGHGAEGLLLGPYSALVVARQMLGIDAGADQSIDTGVLQMCAPERFPPA
jgi:D-amino-acid dehydrogenase